MNEPILASSDPRPVLDAAFHHDHAERIGDLLDPRDRLAAICVRYALEPVEARVADTTRRYVEAAASCTAEDRRWVQARVRQFVEQIGLRLGTAFVPFMMLDEDYSLVSTAALDYASLYPLSEDDPLTCVHDAIAMAVGGRARQPFAILSGLLALGDPRVCELLQPLRERIPDTSLEEFTHASSMTFALCVFEFYARWALALVDARDPESESRFGHVMAGLVRLARNAAEHPEIGVRTGLRPFPVPVDGSSWPDTQLIPLSEAAEILALSLYDIEKREAPPRLAAHALLALGLQPATPQDQWLSLAPPYGRVKQGA